MSPASLGRSVVFLAGAVIGGLALAFIVVFFKPELLVRTLPKAPSQSAPAANATGTTGAAAAPAGVPGATPAAAAANGSTTAPEVLAPFELVTPLHRFGSAVRRAAPAVVNIYTRRVVVERVQPSGMQQFFGEYWPRMQQRVQGALGSGVIVDENGHIVTNNHVIANATTINVQLADGRVAEAKVVGRDPDTDLAVLVIKLGTLPVMALGRSDTLRVGDIVLAIGNPYGLSQTVTQGIVSATGRGQLGLATFENFIQTDAAINLGNSGGALRDVHGDLVGIKTAVLNRAYGGPEGIGFAIPVNLVRGVMEQILKRGHVVRGWLGFVPQDLSDEQAAQLGIAAGGGVIVVNILVKSPAFEAGVRPGDLITALNGEPVQSAQDLVSRLAALAPGAQVELAGRHGRQAFKVNLKVVERPTHQAAQSE